MSEKAAEFMGVTPQEIGISDYFTLNRTSKLVELYYQYLKHEREKTHSKGDVGGSSDVYADQVSRSIVEEDNNNDLNYTLELEGAGGSSMPKRKMSAKGIRLNVLEEGCSTFPISKEEIMERL